MEDHSSKLGRRLLLILGGVVLLILLAVGADALFYLYDLTIDPRTRSGGVTLPPVPLKSGSNQLCWQVSHAANGLDLLVVGRRISEQELGQLEAGIGGSLSIVCQGSDGEDSQHTAEYFFRLLQQSAIRASSVERTSLDLPGKASDRVALGVRYDVTYTLESTLESRSAALDFHTSLIPSDHNCELTIFFDDEIPSNLELVVSYAKLPRSLMRHLLRSK